MNEAEEQRLVQLAARAGEVAAALPSEEFHASGRSRLLASAASERAAHRSALRRRSRALPLAVAAAAIAAGAFLYLDWREGRALSYDVRGGVMLMPNSIEAPRDASAALRFSDGSEVEARPGARLRVDETSNRGARVLVEHGAATASIAHTGRSRWDFVAGPFRIHVTGTKLSVSWEPERGELFVTLHEGSVEIESPVGASRCVVRKGQRFRASLADGTMNLESADTPVRPQPPAARDAKPSASSATAAGTLEPERGAPGAGNLASTGPVTPGLKARSSSPARHVEAPAPAPVERVESWTELLRRGAFQAVVDAANTRGISATLASGSAEDIRALAEAARYSGHTELARTGLTSLRARFPGTRHSEAAGFLLGRISESGGALEAADHWYRVYLGEAPDGELAGDALAGRMRTLAAEHGAAAAKPIALEYLRRFPDGVHAQMARRMVERARPL